MLESEPISPPLSQHLLVRFGTTLVANVLRGGISFIAAVVIARELGASSYGDLNFLLGSFVAINMLLEMGTSSAFYTFISQRKRSRSFFALYAGWLLMQFGSTLLVLGLVLPNSLIERVWVGHPRGIVLLAFAGSFLMTQVWGMVSQLGEAVRKTVVIQAAAVLQALVHLVLIVAAVHWRWLNVETVIGLLMFEYLFIAVVLAPKLIIENQTAQTSGNDEIKATVGQFTTYCKPLVVYGWVGFLYVFADRWLLQNFGGAEQQGYFAVGQQFANISLIATTSILRVYWKEIAEARHRNDHERVVKLYNSVSRGLYFAAAWISCLLIPFSQEILISTVGPGYEGGWLCLALMFLYPVHQTLGQIQGTFFYASGETGSYTRIGLVMMIVSIPVTYFMLAPRSSEFNGLGLGAVGLAIKLVLLQIIGVNVQNYVIARKNGWRYDPAYQVMVLGWLVVLGYACKWSVLGLVNMVSLGSSITRVILPAGLLYALVSLTFLYRKPEWIGLTHRDIRYAVGGTMRWLRLGTVS